MKNLMLFELEENYYNFLVKYDSKIMYNKNAPIGSRPYVGIVLDINNYKYFAPLTSPKPKQNKQKIRHSIDMILIDNGKYGAINLNNMIPAKLCFLKIKKYDILANDTLKEKQYKLLLANQIQWCNILNNKNLIKTNANQIYKIKNNNRVKNKNILKLKERCCDFKILEKQCDIAFNVLMEKATNYKNIIPKMNTKN